MLRKIAVARFCRTLGTLLSAGVPVLESLDITARTSGNAVIEQRHPRGPQGGRGGQDLAEPLKTTKQFPPMVVQMISVGETTGAMDTMLGEDRGVLRGRGRHRRSPGMMKLIEPVMIFFLGVVVGGIVIAMYLPMFDLISKIG